SLPFSVSSSSLQYSSIFLIKSSMAAGNSDGSDRDENTQSHDENSCGEKCEKTVAQLQDTIRTLEAGRDERDVALNRLKFGIRMILGEDQLTPDEEKDFDAAAESVFDLVKEQELKESEHGNRFVKKLLEKQKELSTGLSATDAASLTAAPAAVAAPPTTAVAAAAEAQSTAAAAPLIPEESCLMQLILQREKEEPIVVQVEKHNDGLKAVVMQKDRETVVVPSDTSTHLQPFFPPLHKPDLANPPPITRNEFNIMEKFMNAMNFHLPATPRNPQPLSTMSVPDTTENLGTGMRSIDPKFAQAHVGEKGFPPLNTTNAAPTTSAAPNLQPQQPTGSDGEEKNDNSTKDPPKKKVTEEEKKEEISNDDNHEMSNR
ncbi:hypothetical protein PFISCL1PPCAC_5394, partial [Pristionchus fissidentatus]